MQQQQPNNMFGDNSQGGDINPLEYPSVVCSECGSEFFIPALMFRKVPGSLFGQAGNTIQYPMKVFVCKNCGKLSPDDQAVYDNLALKAEKSKTKPLFV